MAAGTSETLVPDGDGERGGIEAAQLYANTHDTEGQLRVVQEVDASYVEGGIMELQDYLGVATAAIYEHVRTLRETHSSVLDQERQPALRAKSLPVGRTATRIFYRENNRADLHPSTDTSELPGNFLG